MLCYVMLLYACYDMLYIEGPFTVDNSSQALGFSSFVTAAKAEKQPSEVLRFVIKQRQKIRHETWLPEKNIACD